LDEFVQAVATLQGYTRTAASRSHYLTERYDEALNDLIRNPDRPGDSDRLVAVAVSNSRKKIALRGVRTPRAASDALAILEITGGARTTSPPSEPQELPEWFTRLRPRSRHLLGLSALGFRPAEIAQIEGVSPKYAWEALSRARAEARALIEEAA
jgi:DNA-directed RNA polymerase specialized sigma24 family protein